MPSSNPTLASRAGRMGVSKLQRALSAGRARAAVKSQVAAKGPFRRPEGTPNCLPLAPYVERDPVAEAAARAAFEARWDKMFEDAVWEQFTEHKEPTGPNLLYDNSPLVYSRYGETLYKYGWLSFPQKKLGSRGPEGGIEYSEWRKQYPPLKEVKLMASEFPFSNVAIMLGEVSHWSIAFDVDVMDELVCNRIRALMEEHLGPIRMQRWGQYPKFIGLYRTAPDVEVRAQSYSLRLPEDYMGKQPALEVLGHRSVFTAFGFHHRTGELFKWAPCSPYLSDPRDLTLVTPAQINAFLHAVHQEFPFLRAPRSGSQGCSHDPDNGQEYAACELAGACVPLLPLDGGQWTHDGAEVTDGRYMWMRRHSLALVCGNPELIRAKQARALADAAWPYVSSTLSDRGGDVRQRYLDLVKSTARKFLNGELTEWRIARRADGTAAKLARHVAVARDALDEALSWLGRQHPVGDGPAKARGAQRAPTIRSTPVGNNSAEACARRAAERSLLRDRASVHAIVRGQVVSARDAFLREMEAGGTKVIVSGGPTGAGKTSTTLGPELVTYLRENPRVVDGFDRGPIMVAVPTHSNMSEAAAAAGRAGILLHDEDDDAPAMDAAVADAAAAGIVAVGWKGKGESNCQRWREMALLNEAGISTSGLCRQRVPQEIREHEDGADFEVCRWWRLGLCAYQRMKEAAKVADIVFVSHYWLTAGVLPTEVQQARALVVDESILFRIAQAAVLPLKAFELRREPPRMDSQERKEFDARPNASGCRWDDDQDRADLKAWGQRSLDDRDAASTVAWKAMRAGQDVASVFAGMDNGTKLLDAAVRVCTDGMRQRQAVYPSMTLPDVKRRCGTPMPEFIRLERRFWIIVRDRTKALKGDLATRQRNLDLKRIWDRIRPGDEAAREDLRPTPLLDAQGEPRRDMRLQRLLQPAPVGGTVEGVRVSWRAAINWRNVPTLLLDASADEEIIGRLFPGRQVEMHRPADGEVHLNVRTVLVADGTYSTSSMVPTTIRNDPEADKKCKGLADARAAGVGKLLDLACAAHARGRVLFGAAMAVRKRLAAFTRTWPIVDEVHYGAQRGLDAFKHHQCAISVGRSEMPIWLIDGLVAALTWDAPEPEEPYDGRGDGTVDGKKPLMRVPRMRLVRMRDGRDVEVVVPVMPGDMASRVDRQWREEEISQFRGRLRPVFRDQPATWVHVSSVIPEGIVCDEILTLDEATAPWSPVLATVPDMLGVVSPVETARLAGVPVADVEAYVAAHADDPSWRILSWTDAVTTHVGLMAAWVTDTAVALGMSSIPDTAIIGDLRAPMVPSGTRAPDVVDLARPTGGTLAAAERGFAEAWAANGDGDREAARVGWVRERLDAPPPEPEVLAEAEPDDDDEAPAIDDVGWAGDDEPAWPASWLDTSWSPDALAAG